MMAVHYTTLHYEYSTLRLNSSENRREEKPRIMKMKTMEQGEKKGAKVDSGPSYIFQMRLDRLNIALTYNFSLLFLRSSLFPKCRRILWRSGGPRSYTFQPLNWDVGSTKMIFPFCSYPIGWRSSRRSAFRLGSGFRICRTDGCVLGRGKKTNNDLRTSSRIQVIRYFAPPLFYTRTILRSNDLRVARYL